MMNIRAKSLSRWLAGDKVYADDRRILNPEDPPTMWLWSAKSSPTSAKLPIVLLYPGTYLDAILALEKLHAVGIVFDDEPVQSPFPFGPTWINLKDGKHSWGKSSAEHSWSLDRIVGKRGVLGHQYQDGSKFHSSCDLNPIPTVAGIVLSKNWMAKLANELDALLSKNGPWKNG